MKTISLTVYSIDDLKFEKAVYDKLIFDEMKELQAEFDYCGLVEQVFDCFGFRAMDWNFYPDLDLTSKKVYISGMWQCHNGSNTVYDFTDHTAFSKLCQEYDGLRAANALESSIEFSYYGNCQTPALQFSQYYVKPQRELADRFEKFAKNVSEFLIYEVRTKYKKEVSEEVAHNNLRDLGEVFTITGVIVSSDCP